MNIISRQIICTGIIVLVMVGAIVVLLQPDLFFPAEDRSDGSLQWIFYDTEGNEIDQLAYWAGGVEIGGFKIVCTLAASGNNLASITVTGDFFLKIQGWYYNAKYEAWTLRDLETIPGTLYGDDTTTPYSLTFDFPFDISILDPWAAYREDKGWHVVGGVDASVEGLFANGDTRVKDWSGGAWFDVEWSLDDFQLTGDMGYEYD